MKGVTKAAKRANGKSRACAICPARLRCDTVMKRICFSAFIEGFKKGVKWVEKQQKEV